MKARPLARLALVLAAFTTAACQALIWPSVPEGDRDRGQLVGYTEGGELRVLVGHQDGVREALGEDAADLTLVIRDHTGWTEGPAQPEPGSRRVWFASTCTEMTAPCQGDYREHGADDRFSFPYQSRDEYVGPAPFKACAAARDTQTYCVEMFDACCATRYYAVDSRGTRHVIGEDRRWAWRCAH